MHNFDVAKFCQHFMKYFFAVCLFLLNVFLISCSVSKKNYTPAKKYPQQLLRRDFALLREILENKHPSLYWYMPKDSMDMYFDRYYQQIRDTMTEQQFAWQILAPLVDKIHCGHTSVSLSKAYAKWADGKRFPSFPLSFKVWNDTMAVTGNLNRKDTVFKRGTIVTAINGIPGKTIVKRMFDYLPQDGYADNINFIRVSANFPYYHRNIYGISKAYTITYKDSAGAEKTTTIPVYTPPKDTVKKISHRTDTTGKAKRPVTKPVVKKLTEYRSMSIDSSHTLAIMTLNTFSKGRLRTFFRRSFREIKRSKINNLVLDIRSNGGGKVAISTLLTKYISRKPFKVADTLYAVSKTLAPYTKYIKGRFLNNIELFFISKKQKDGLYHLGHFEKKLYKPKKRNHYNGKVYVLVNGPTFSASTLFCNAVKGQNGIKLLGEETGGGWHGNNGIMIPDIILPITKTRVRLPLFRLVQYNHVPKNGTGILPDVYIGTSYDALLKGYDKKMRVVKEMIYNGVSF